MSPATAYVPGFEHDVLISYAHVDNLARGEAKGWVEEFHEELKNRIATRVGRLGLVRIWRDPLDGSQVFAEVLDRRIAGSAVFVALNPKATSSLSTADRSSSRFAVMRGAAVTGSNLASGGGFSTSCSPTFTVQRGSRILRGPEDLNFTTGTPKHRAAMKE